LGEEEERERKESSRVKEGRNQEFKERKPRLKKREGRKVKVARE
jgi:hypothetical protein